MSRAQRKIDIPNPSVFFPKKLFPIDHVQQLKRPFLVIESSLCTDNKKNNNNNNKQKTKTKNEKKLYLSSCQAKKKFAPFSLFNVICLAKLSPKWQAVSFHHWGWKEFIQGNRKVSWAPLSNERNHIKIFKKNMCASHNLAACNKKT